MYIRAYYTVSTTLFFFFKDILNNINTFCYYLSFDGQKCNRKFALMFYYYYLSIYYDARNLRHNII